MRKTGAEGAEIFKKLYRTEGLKSIRKREEWIKLLQKAQSVNQQNTVTTSKITLDIMHKIATSSLRKYTKSVLLELLAYYKTPMIVTTMLEMSHIFGRSRYRIAEALQEATRIGVSIYTSRFGTVLDFTKIEGGDS